MGFPHKTLYARIICPSNNFKMGDYLTEEKQIVEHNVVNDPKNAKGAIS
jgi:hypothetical protein